MMNKQEQERLESLNKAIESRKPPFFNSDNLLPYDLVLLLTHHPLIHQLVRDIAASDAASTEVPIFRKEEAQTAYPVQAATDRNSHVVTKLHAELDSMRGQLTQLQHDKQALQISLQTEQQRGQDLAKQLARQTSSPLSMAQTFLKAMRADDELSRLWLGTEPEDEQTRVIKFIAIAAHWERVEELWDILALRCKTQQTPIPAVLISLLQGCLLIHNTIWQGRAAGLLAPDIGASFKSNQHERCGSLKGEVITKVWLPGLHNAAGQARRKSLVKTD